MDPREPARRLFRLTPRGAWRQEIDDELQFHLEMRSESLMTRGMDAEQARGEALRQFGDVEQRRQECRTVDRRRARRAQLADVLQGIRQDVTIAWRGFRRTPLFTLVVLLTIALGVGANTAVFSVVNAVLLRPLPFRDPDRLVAVRLPGDVSGTKQLLAELQLRQHTMTDIAGYSGWGFAFTGHGNPENLNGAMGTPSLFAVLGAKANLGRTFLPSDDVAGESVVVLSDRLWRRRFGSDPHVVGQRIVLNAMPYTVVGVMPPQFEFPTRQAELWALTPSRGTDAADYARGAYLLYIGRLRPGVAAARAKQDLATVTASMRQVLPDFFQKNLSAGGMTVISWRERYSGDSKRPMLVLLGAVGFVLLVACVNVANLLIARATTRRREFALRTALGAARARITRQLLLESLLLAGAGGLLGLLLVFVLTRLLGTLLPPDLFVVGSVGVDARVLAFTVAASVGAGLLFGILPSIRGSSADPHGVLQESGRTASAGRDRRLLQRGLVAAELALALVLVVAAGLMLRSFTRLTQVDPGFTASGVLAIRVSPPDNAMPTSAQRREYYATLLERLAALPAVESVGAIHLTPFGGSNWNPDLAIRGQPAAASESREIDWRVVTLDFFHTMRIPLVRGRLFTPQDDSTAVGVALLNRTAAARYFPGEDPIGRQVNTAFEGEGQWLTVVGVVADMRDQSLAGAPRPQIYRPYGQRANSEMTLLVRTHGDLDALVRPAQAAIWSVNRDATLSDVGPLEGFISQSIGAPRLILSLLGVFAALALLLASLGIYGVMAYSVRERRGELAIRAALGARPSDLVRLIIGDAAQVIGVGVAIGVVAALLLTRVLASQLFEVASNDPMTLVIVVGMVLGVAAIASWLPAYRASRLDPVRSLGGA